MDVLVFGGTSEGRRIAERLCAHPSLRVVACTATDYGACLLDARENLKVIASRLDEQAMEALMRTRDFRCVVDATHPYAATASKHIAAAAQACGIKLVRVVREGEPDGPWAGASTPEQAAAYAAKEAGNILLTTGTNDLEAYVAAIPDYQDRLYVRVLPMGASLAKVESLGISPRHVIAMQGPFSFELNCALIRDLDIACMVTKASGAAGGFGEKVDAARACGIRLVVLHRPVQEEGVSWETACEIVLGQAVDEGKGRM